MGPVSFSRLSFGDRGEALEAARRLTEAGIRVRQGGSESSLLVGGDQIEAARNLLAEDDLDPTESTGPMVRRPIKPLLEPFTATVSLPGSKSHTNRALLCAALAEGRSTLRRVLMADDTEAMLDSLERLGVGLTIDTAHDPETVVLVDGVGRGGFQAGDGMVELDVRQSGTTSRFLVPALATGSGRFVVDGDAQLRSRPFGPQVEALVAMGADIEGSSLPLTIIGRRMAGGRVDVGGSVSSQFLSGLMLAAPLFESDTVIQVASSLVSRPYVELSMHTMADFGVEVQHDFDTGWFRVPAVGYQPATVDLEPDASAASYFFAAAAITGSTVRIEGLGRSTVQGDLGFVDLLARMGAEVEITDDATSVTGTGRLRGITADMADISDTAQTMAVVAACAEGPTEITGIGFIRHKETDRIAAPVAELQRLGIRAEAADDGFVVHPGPVVPAVVETYDDHRMAMSFALLGLVNRGIVIDNPGCVNKTFPRFFDVLDSLSAGSSR